MVVDPAAMVLLVRQVGVAPRPGPDLVGLKVSGALSWWFFAKAQSEGTIKVTLKMEWEPDSDRFNRRVCRRAGDSTAQS
jgi:hypothetical protein